MRLTEGFVVSELAAFLIGGGIFALIGHAAGYRRAADYYNARIAAILNKYKDTK